MTSNVNESDVVLNNAESLMERVHNLTQMGKVTYSECPNPTVEDMENYTRTTNLVIDFFKLVHNACDEGLRKILDDKIREIFRNDYITTLSLYEALTFQYIIKYDSQHENALKAKCDSYDVVNKLNALRVLMPQVINSTLKDEPLNSDLLYGLKLMTLGMFQQIFLVYPVCTVIKPPRTGSRNAANIIIEKMEETFVQLNNPGYKMMMTAIKTVVQQHLVDTNFTEMVLIGLENLFPLYAYFVNAYHDTERRINKVFRGNVFHYGLDFGDMHVAVLVNANEYTTPCNFEISELCPFGNDYYEAFQKQCGSRSFFGVYGYSLYGVNTFEFETSYAPSLFSYREVVEGYNPENACGGQFIFGYVNRSPRKAVFPLM